MGRRPSRQGRPPRKYLGDEPERPWNFYHPNTTFSNIQKRYLSNDIFFSSPSPTKLLVSSFTHNCPCASSSQPTLFDTVSNNKMENENNALNSWIHTSSMPDPWTISSLPFSSHQSRPTLDTLMANLQRFPNAQYPWTPAPSTYHTSSQPESQLQHPFSGGSTMLPQLRNSFSYPDLHIPTEFPSYLSLDTTPFDMNDINSSDQFSSKLAAGPYFSRLMDMVVELPHQGNCKGNTITGQPKDSALDTLNNSKRNARTRQSRDSTPDTPKCRTGDVGTRRLEDSAPDTPTHRPPVYGFYSNRMERAKTTGSKVTRDKKTGGKTAGGNTTGPKTIRVKTTRTRKVASTRETQTSPSERGLRKRGGSRARKMEMHIGPGVGRRKSGDLGSWGG